MKLDPIVAEWYTHPDIKQWTLSVGNEDGSFEGEIAHNNSGELYLSTYHFEIDEAPKNTEANLGKLIMTGAFALAKTYGVVYEGEHVISPADLMIRHQLFGEQMTFAAPLDSDNELPMTINQAVQSIQRELEVPDADLPGLLVRSDLRLLDTSGWEIPQELNKPFGL